MAKKDQYAPPKRKEPGLVGSVFSGLIQLCIWLVISLLISIVIEWIGMIWFWPDQGANHARTVFISDENYLNQHLKDSTSTIKAEVIDFTNSVVSWIDNQSTLQKVIEHLPSFSEDKFSGLRGWAIRTYENFDEYLEASGYVTQTFFIRLSLILFSLPIFFLAALVGAVDGLAERDLRRWGGGRESSNVFNIARSTVVPTFVTACVIYISLPISVHPAIVILPFALLFGLAVRVAFDRLKKYF